MKNPLNKRLPRELKSEFGKHLVLFIFLAGMIALVSGFLVADGSMLKAYEQSFEKYNIEDGNFELDEEVSELPTAQVIQRCIINPVNEQTNQLLQGLTLKELVEKTEEITAYSAEMYYI